MRDRQRAAWCARMGPAPPAVDEGDEIAALQAGVGVQVLVKQDVAEQHRPSGNTQAFWRVASQTLVRPRMVADCSIQVAAIKPCQTMVKMSLMASTAWPGQNGANT